MSDEVLQQFISSLDANNDNKISFDEFKTFMLKQLNGEL